MKSNVIEFFMKGSSKECIIFTSTLPEMKTVGYDGLMSISAGRSDFIIVVLADRDFIIYFIELK